MNNINETIQDLSDAQLRQIVHSLAQDGGGIKTESDAVSGNPAAADTRVLETHISLVLLSGPWAWKFKKPVNFGFLDFSTPALRRHYCEEELRLNRRTAPDLYMDVQEIRGSVEAPHFGGSGPLLTHAVRMRRFDPDRTLDQVLSRAGLETRHVDAMARSIARFHDHAAIAGANTDWDCRQSVLKPVANNFQTLRETLPDAMLQDLETDALEQGIHRLGETLVPVFTQRKRQGHVRECHGDLHLGNLALIGGNIVAFDALEFNPGLRWIDTASDLGFLVMDLEEKGRTDLSRRFLSLYLEHRSDWDALSVLPYYQSYRALVRAKVTALRRKQCTEGTAGDSTADAQPERIASYVKLARACLTPPAPALYLTHGVSGSGKSTAAMTLVETLGAIRIRSDVERRRLFSDPGQRYAPAAGARTYARLLEIANHILSRGYPVIVDATFLKRDQRAPFLKLARQRNVPAGILALDAPAGILRQRIQQRRKQGQDASEADGHVLDKQIKQVESLTEEECALAFNPEHVPLL